MNKKSQYDSRPLNQNMFGRAHPVLIFGIMVYASSYFIHNNWHNLLSYLGLTLIVVGSIASIFNISTGVD